MSPNRRRRQHRTLLSLSLTIIFASINKRSKSLAFLVASNRKWHGKPSNLRGLRSNTLDGVQYCCNGARLWCNIMSFAASIAISPSPPMASIQHPYSISDFGDWSGAASVPETKPSSFVTELGLKPATDSKPQITLKGRMEEDQSLQHEKSRKSNRVPILQGLVYFPEFAPKDLTDIVHEGEKVTQQVDYFNDLLILTAVSSSRPSGPILAGAKMPISSIRFPFSFQMYEENLLVGKPGVRADWEKAVNSEDIILRASICPSDSASFPCNDMERKKYAEGVAKLISKLPGLKEGDQIRAPASLPLQ